jgi:hypothetical protein
MFMLPPLLARRPIAQAQSSHTALSDALTARLMDEVRSGAGSVFLLDVC